MNPRANGLALISLRTRQRLAGWICVLTHALSLAALAAHGGSVFTPPENNRTSKLVSGGGGVETGYWTYTHNVANQLTGWKKWTAPAGGTELRSATLTYDANGNRTSQVIGGVAHDGGDLTPANIENGTTTYTWDLQNRLIGVAMPSGRTFGYQYDYRSRRVGISDSGTGPVKHTAVVFSEGLSVAEYESSTGFQPVVSGAPVVQYVRGTLRTRRDIE